MSPAEGAAGGPLAPVLETRSLGKLHPGTRALDDVSLAFSGGRVHAIVGRNGAGKSTLVKIIAGAMQPTSGSLLIDGMPVRIASPREARARGIATVHQELSLAGDLSVADNILLGRHPRLPVLGLIDHRASRDAAASVLAGLGVALDPDARVARLSFAEQQIVEIARAVSQRPRVLLLDEPTSALSRAESDALFSAVRALAASGVAVVHVTHRLDELALVADMVSVLRDGRHVATISGADASPARLVELMFGATDVVRRAPRRTPPRAGAPALSVGGLASAPRLRDASFDVRGGEILGLAGMQGSGRTEILRAIFGATEASGDVSLDGTRVGGRRSPRRMARLGVALVPEDRKREGLALGLSILDNASFAGLGAMARAGFVTRALQRRVVRPILARLHLSTADLDRDVATLSGGNQQKVVVGRWLAVAPRVMLLDEPTRGIDLHSRRELFDAVRELADEGVAVVIVSSELEELLDACDRILVVREGRVVREAPANATLAELFGLAMAE